VNTLKTIDLMHFGWNVWNHYRGNNQRKDVAKFLKIVFSESFKEMEESTIEKLLLREKRKD
jgi:predicted negative regulator of RcsB-dependent stress response